MSSSSERNSAIGEVTIEQVKNGYLSFSENYQSFSISAEDMERIAKWPTNITISVYFGTWCHDSEREVPKLFRIAEASPNVGYSWVALDSQKTDPLGMAKHAGVKFTPTIVIFNGKEELGRIIERPKVSLVDDIDKIINHG